MGLRRFKVPVLRVGNQGGDNDGLVRDEKRREEERRGEVVIPVHEVLTYCMHAEISSDDTFTRAVLIYL